MSEKKSKAKAIEPIEPIEVVKAGKTRREKLSNYLIDISKYVMTGVVIASLFKDFNDNRPLIYVGGLLIALSALCVGLVLTDKTIPLFLLCSESTYNTSQWSGSPI